MFAHFYHSGANGVTFPRPALHRTSHSSNIPPVTCRALLEEEWWAKLRAAIGSRQGEAGEGTLLVGENDGDISVSDADSERGNDIASYDIQK